MAATDLLTMDEVMEAVSMTGSGAKHGFNLAAVNEAVSEAIDAWVGPVVVRTITAELHYVDGQQALVPRYRPVYAVTSITEYQSGTGTVVTAESATAAGGYLLDPADYTITRRSSGFAGSSWYGNAVSLTYQAGRFLTTETVGARYKMAARGVIVGWWSKYAGAWARGGDPFGDGTAGGAGFFDEFLPVVMRWLPDQIDAPAVA